MSSKRFSTDFTSKKSLDIKRFGFIGISLGGGKSDKTSLLYLEYYPQSNKIFINDLSTKMKSDGDISSDLIIHEQIIEHQKRLEYVAFNVPLSLPKCVTCKLKCPGYEICDEEEILWMWDHYRKLEAENKEKKIFTPYTERCIEQYLTTEIIDSVHVQHALGSNMAPLTSRALFIKRRLHAKTIEVLPKLSLWRIGNALSLPKTHIKMHKHSAAGEESRRAILNELIQKNIIFVYDQDLRLLIQNVNAFDAFVGAFTAVLKFKGQCELRPRDFPKKEGWIEIPKEKFVW